jgi:Lon protease-like protein
MNDADAIAEFDGTARLFPLPNLVLFPQVVQPLHIFEPRYRQMTADAIAGDGLIALVLLRPGWEDLFQGNPAIHRVACVGRIVAEQELPDGRFNILLRGLKRMRIRKEIESDKLYRVAKADLLECNPPEDLAIAKQLRAELSEALLPRFNTQAGALQQVTDLFHSELTLGALVDVLGFALPLPPEMKQGLLEQLDVAKRARHLIQLVDCLRPDNPVLHAPAGSRKFPPDFSAN